MSHAKLKHRVSRAALTLLRPRRAGFSPSVSGSASRRGLGSGWAGPAASGWAGGDLRPGYLGPPRQSPSRAFQGSIALRGLTSPQRLQSGTVGQGGRGQRRPAVWQPRGCWDGNNRCRLGGTRAAELLYEAIVAAAVELEEGEGAQYPRWVPAAWVPAARVSHLRAALGLGWPRAGAAVGGPCSLPDAGPALLSLPARVRSAGCSPSAPASFPVLICSRTGRGCWVCQ